MGKKNYGKSVKTRLLNLMNETGYKYMYLWLDTSTSGCFTEYLLVNIRITSY